jgi:hypothetical protein
MICFFDRLRANGPQRSKDTLTRVICQEFSLEVQH